MQQGTTPVSTMPAVMAQFPYKARVVMDGPEDCDVGYGIGEIYAVDNTTKKVSVRRPTVDSLPATRCVIFGGSDFVANATALVSAADFTIDTKPVLVAVDPTSAAPVLGDSVGTVAGSWGVKVGNTGYTVTCVESSTVVYVRPAGGAGASPFDYQFAGSEVSGFSFYFGSVPNAQQAVPIQEASYEGMTIDPVTGTQNGTMQYRQGSGAVQAFGEVFELRNREYIHANGIEPYVVLFICSGRPSDPIEKIPFERYTPYDLKYEGARIYNWRFGSAFKTPDNRLWAYVGFELTDPDPTYKPLVNELYELTTLGGSIEGALHAKANTAQAIGSATLQVTTGGAVDLVEYNAVLVGTGDNRRRYRLTAPASQPSAGQNLTLHISPPLSVALTGGESVTLTRSWVLASTEKNTKNGGFNYFYPHSGYGFSFVKGRPTNDRAFLATPQYSSDSSAQAYSGILYFDEQWYKVPVEKVDVSGTSTPIYQIKNSITGMWATKNQLYAFGGYQVKSGGSWTAGMSVLKHNGTGWGTVSVTRPDGIPATATLTQARTICYLPNDTACIELIWSIYSPSYSTMNSYHIFDGTDVGEAIAGEEYVISTRYDYSIPIGCSADGWGANSLGALYFATVAYWGGIQVRPGTIPTYSQVGVPESPLVLYGCSAGGSITGVLNTPASVAQAVGSMTLKVKTIAETGALSFNTGTLLRVVKGGSTDYYSVASPISAGADATVTVNLRSPLLTALTGGEVVTIYRGWAQKLVQLRYPGTNIPAQIYSTYQLNSVT